MVPMLFHDKAIAFETGFVPHLDFALLQTKLGQLYDRRQPSVNCVTIGPLQSRDRLEGVSK